VAPKTAHRDERTVKKELTNIERTIAKLDQQKKEINAKLQVSTDPTEALKLHNEVTSLTEQLAVAEDRWCQLQAELEDDA